MEKECEICGGYFTTNSTVRKYCDECKMSSSRKKRQLTRSINIHKKIYANSNNGDYTCSMCNKEFSIPSKYLVKDGQSNVYCSIDCKNKHSFRNTPCLYCGTRVGNIPNPLWDKKLNHYFCNEKCQQAYNNPIEQEVATVLWDGNDTDKYTYKTCVVCNKVYRFPKENNSSDVDIPFVCSFACEQARRKANRKQLSLVW